MKPFLEKLQLKSNLSFILFLIFLVVSILLSYKLSLEQQSAPASIEREKQMLSYRLAMLNQTFKDNYKIAGEKLFLDNAEIFSKLSTETQDSPVLYLKEDACLKLL